MYCNVLFTTLMFTIKSENLLSKRNERGRRRRKKRRGFLTLKTHKPPIFFPNKSSDYRIIDFFDLNPSLTVIFINGFFPSDVVMWMRNHMNINDVWHSRMTKITQHAEAKLTQNNQNNVKTFPKNWDSKAPSVGTLLA